MIFGCCTTVASDLDLFDRYGYAVFEAHFQKLLEMSETEFAEFARDIATKRAKLAGVNCFAHPEAGLLSRMEEDVDGYFERGIQRIKTLGLEYIVIGSGGARKIPETMSAEEGRARLAAMLRRFGDIADKYDVDVYFEALRKFETNNVNTVSDAVALCREVNHSRVGLVADFYHMRAVDEPFSALKECGDCLRHIHVATADRRVPLTDDKAEVEAMAEMLKTIGYRGRIVLEGKKEPDIDTALSEFSAMFSLFE